ncbi:uncharacterized protein LOC114968302 [Acropora millepora]|uniref:uncharacterized protein LOC114968302 n=1 Tax=Acropora millepora TaxID=45264 RepID=UPI0010FC6B76|nr:uncharacterized protein LOC114968302 [Acropora millepora]
MLLVFINSSTNYDSREESPYCGIALEGQIRSINMTTSTVLLLCVIGIVLLCPWLEAIQNYKCSGCKGSFEEREQSLSSAGRRKIIQEKERLSRRNKICLRARELGCERSYSNYN